MHLVPRSTQMSSFADACSAAQVFGMPELDIREQRGAAPSFVEVRGHRWAVAGFAFELRRTETHPSRVDERTEFRRQTQQCDCPLGLLRLVALGRLIPRQIRTARRKSW